MPTLPNIVTNLPHEVWIGLALAAGIVAGWLTYSLPQMAAIQRGWPRVYYATPYVGFGVGVVIYWGFAAHSIVSAFLGMAVIYLWIDSKLAGPGYENGRELYLKYGDGWQEHWEQPEVPV